MKNKKIIYTIVGLLPIVIIYFVVSKRNTPLTITKNSQSPTAITEVNSSNLFYLNSNIKNIEWNDSISLSEELPQFYSVKSLDMASEADNIVEKLKFSSKNYIDIDEGDKMWKNDNYTVIYNNTDKIIEISYPPKTTYKSGFIEKQLTDEAKKIVSNIVRIPNLEISRIEYFKLDGLESENGQKEDSKIAKVSFTQLIPNTNKKIIPENFTDNSTVVLTIDSSLNPRYLKINNIIVEATPSEAKKNIQFDKDKIKSSLLHRITPFDIGLEIELEKSTETSMDAKEVTVSYTQINNILFPVFVIKGDVRIGSKNIGSADFVSPTTNSESL